jgi:hypothetical protein
MLCAQALIDIEGRMPSVVLGVHHSVVDIAWLSISLAAACGGDRSRSP